MTKGHFRAFAYVLGVAALAAACTGDGSAGENDAGTAATTTAPAEPDAPAVADEAPTATEPAEPAEPEPAEPQGPPHIAELAWGNFELSERIAAKLEADERLNFVISLRATGEGGFADSFEHGWQQAAAAAAEEHGVQINARVIGPHAADAESQSAAIEALLSTGDIDCLAVDAANPGLLDDAIDAAADAGVPVFAVGGDSPDSKRFAFHGPDDVEAGRAAGSLVGQWAEDGGILVRVAGVLTGDAADQGSYDLMRGFVAGLSEIHSGVIWANSPEDVESFGYDPVSVYDRIEAWVLDNSDADIVFFTDAGVESLAAVMADQLLYGDMYAVGFHMSPTMAAFIRERLVVAAMVPRHAEQARLAGQACGDFLLQGTLQTGHIIVEPLAVTLDNVEDADWSLPENL
ncbi:sugar ABC transporter substrate-binding protein [Candidatus Poriferisodalis sp.]|uniref:sugar ABC transporter substrate-binding protein n=1 Tax=Candidatus Poriferisodalis sp. TaxID=3101277 RepID=UPI003C6FCEA6